VTELDLQQSFIPVDLIEHLAAVMPEDYTGEGYDYNAFLDSLGSGMASTDRRSKSSDETKGQSGRIAGRSKHYL
jgi:hypothetical protein